MKPYDSSGGPERMRPAGICPSCFRQGMINNRCSLCGFDLEKEVKRPRALNYFHSLRNGTYTIGRVLGEGGFGITYLSMRGEERCCIKEYVPDDLSCRRESSGRVLVPMENQEEFQEGKKLFLEEARILQQFRDFPGIVNIWDYFEENGTCYFAMEYLDGCNLRTFQRRNTEKRRELKSMADRSLMEIGRALEEIHKSGLIHGDVSPENIMITKNGVIKLIDFGTARLYRSSSGKGIRAFVKSGYAPYEMYLPDQKVGPWSDVYSLAATYYAVLTGVKVPDARERMEKDLFRPLKDMCADITPGVSDAVGRALVPDYRERTESMEVFLAEMQAALSEGETLRRNAGGVGRGEASKAAGVAAGSSRDVSAGAGLLSKKTGFFRFGGARRREKRIYLEMHVGTGVQRIWRLPADTTMTAGRRRECDIVLPTDNLLSREHCDLEYSSWDRCLWITDHSSRGTYRGDGRRLPRNQACRFNIGEEFYLSVPGYRFKVTEE